jgi:hypothetical protein
MVNAPVRWSTDICMIEPLCPTGWADAACELTAIARIAAPLELLQAKISEHKSSGKAAP